MSKLLATLIAATWLAGTAPALGQPAESGTVETAPGISIHYERIGSGSQLVLIPGRLFMPEFRALAAPGRTIVRYDMRNRGRSGRVEDVAQINILGDVADVEALRRHFGAERMALIGYSYLGLMTALYAAQHPERVTRLVQIGPVPRQFTTPYPADQIADQSTLDAAGRAAAQAYVAMRDAGNADPAARCQSQARYLSYLLVGNPANHVRVPNQCALENESIANQQRHLDAHFGDIQNRNFERAQFTTLAIPVLTIHGTLDRNAPYGAGLEWATTFPDGRLITVEGAAHQLWLDDPAVIGEIDRFLAGEWPARAQRFGRQ